MKTKQDYEDDHWLFQPHTLTILVISFLTIIYFSMYQNSTSNEATNIRNGIVAAILVFLLFCAIQLNDSFFVRPHRVIWRVVTGIAIVYFVFLVFLLFQTPEYTREFFTVFDSNLGKPLPERSYASDCRVFTPEKNASLIFNLNENVFDIFTLAHAVGWFGKAVIFRNFYLTWFMSVWFEVLEKSLKHVLPNFAECWWDHLILDILVCNALGIWIGQKLLVYFEAKEYNWMGINHLPLNKIPTASGKIKRIFLQFMPVYWTKYEWDFLSSPRRFVGTIFLVFLGSLIELNCFFLKFVLWHPPEHFIVITRLTIWWLISLPASREYYEFINNKNNKKLGTMAWLAFAIIGIETLLWIKCSPGQFNHVTSHPPHIVAVWILGIIGLFTFGILHFIVFNSPIKKKTN